MINIQYYIFYKGIYLFYINIQYININNINIFILIYLINIFTLIR